MTDLQVPPFGPFVDDQDPDKPFYVNRTLGAMSKIKSTYKDGRWLYAKNMTDEEIRAFYKAPDGAVIERQGETVAVWVSLKGKEPKFPAFDEPSNDGAITSLGTDGRIVVEAVPSKAETQPAPPSARVAPAPLPVPIAPYVPSRDIEGTLRTCGMKLFELIENVQGTHKDEAHKLLVLSNEIHAMAARFELGRLRAGMKKR
jgi:hypothetical protein